MRGSLVAQRLAEQLRDSLEAQARGEWILITCGSPDCLSAKSHPSYTLQRENKLEPAGTLRGQVACSLPPAIAFIIAMITFA